MPEVYESANTYLTEQADALVNTEIERSKEFIDPIREFETSMAEVEGSLRNWLSLDKDVRIRLVKGWAVMMTSPRRDLKTGKPIETDEERDARVQVAWKSLNVVIQEESRSEEGFREIALMALNGLFPQAPPKKAD